MQGRIVEGRDGATSCEEAPEEYEGVRLIGVDRDKLVALCDVLLFYCQVARLRTRPVTMTECKGCVTLTWSQYAPAVFRSGRLLHLSADGQMIDSLTIQ